jgi:hypothetical protein
MRWLTAILFAVTFGVSVQAASIEARLIQASNEVRAHDEHLDKLAPKLKKVFGYQFYTQLGIQKSPLKDNERLRLDLGEGIVIFVTPKAEEKQVRVMDFEMYSGRAALVKSTLHVPREHAMFVKGPEVGGSLLIVSFAVVE